MKTYFKSLLLVSMLLFSALALADPPGRVGRIAYTQGTVSFRSSYNDEPVAAELNWPVTSQNILSTASGARTEVRIGSTALRLGSNSELEITQLDDEHLKLYLTQGSASIRIKSRDMAQDFELQTPQGLVRLTEPSRLRVDAERRSRTTALSLFSGAARFESPDSNFSLRAGNRMEITDGDITLSDARAGDYMNEFDSWSAARDQRDDASASVRYLSPETTGYEELDRYGAWRMTEAYGAVWYPTVVPIDWAPYRAGRWTWIEPWGWTWVDSAPWGYAPSHYGRWVSLDRRWCWVPGAIVARPIWAPALVGWVGGDNWNVAFSIGSAPAVGWFPLAPREVFVPSYSVSTTYVRQVNITNVTNITNITNVTTQTNYQNRLVQNAVTVMPQERFVAHRTVVVAPSQAVLRQPQQVQAAPVSAMVPTAIARTNVVPAPTQGRENHRRERDAAQERQAAPTQPAPLPAPVTSHAPRDQEMQRAPTRVQPQPPQPIQVQPVVSQPAPRGPAADEARDRAQERRDNPAVRVERREAAPVQVERRETAPVRVERREAAPAQVERREAAPVRVERREAAPAQVERREAAPVRVERREAAPVQVERREMAPVRVERREAAPAQMERRETAPVRVERREAAPAQMERREMAPVRVERHEAAPVQVERRVVQPAAPAAREPEAGREHYGRETRHPSAESEASGARAHQQGAER